MIKSSRILSCQSGAYRRGPVLYWMNRDCRLHDNWAYVQASEVAKAYQAPLLVAYNLDIGFLGGGYRQHVFKIEGLKEVASLAKARNVPFFVVAGGGAELAHWARERNIGYVVTDMSPLCLQRRWLNQFTDVYNVTVDLVDAHNIVPVWVASDKQEYTARTIRPKIHQYLDEYLESFPRLMSHPYDYDQSVPVIDWEALIKAHPQPELAPVVDWITPGESAGQQAIERFVAERLDNYGEGRNNALISGQSDLSPYLHYGQIAPARVALEVVEAVNQPASQIIASDRNGASTSNNSSAFLEELVVRRELSDNFCWYNQDYNNPKGFPDWAQTSLKLHESDKREFLYDYDTFRDANTHDPLWNAAQTEMLIRGKMHGYMRMYWAKKILQWTPSADVAMKIAIQLNDTYELDGRDPNGYTGIAWSIGGVHDHGWTERPIFGKVRYMTEQAVARRFDPERYIAEYQQADRLL